MATIRIISFQVRVVVFDPSDQFRSIAQWTGGSEQPIRKIAGNLYRV